MPDEKRSDRWSGRYASSLSKWKKIIEKTEARENFFGTTGFKLFDVWTICGYCKEFGYFSAPVLTDFCKNCPLNQRKATWEKPEIPICNNNPHKDSVVRLFVKEMNKHRPNREKAIKLAKIVRDEIAKDKPK